MYYCPEITDIESHKKALARYHLHENTCLGELIKIKLCKHMFLKEIIHFGVLY